MATARDKVKGREFPEALRKLIDDRFEGNMTKFGKATNIAIGTLGHYLGSNRHPRPDVLDSMLKILDDADRVALTLAYLRDMAPPVIRPRVRLQGAPVASEELPAPVQGEDITPELSYLGRYAIHNREVGEMLRFTALAFGYKG